ncbi:hypothetical protein LP316_11745 [Thalassotalea sp. LPB0316]|uniref:hypothetical protein n=1 Tax=Thalassotalea sp. LPB0316 TaxID=2769490 RepID=UPI0018668927|nr:hypothetical protein [Thalassotalea sp. LPB0316]QOL24975.1 hypothetical protein LP316_11745 [Thalassotalea sp. LPB0316]
MNSQDIEKLNEKKALEESLKGLEAFDEERLKNKRTKFLALGALLFLISFATLINLNLPFEAFLVGAGIAISIVFTHFATFVGKTTFYAKYTNSYVDIKAMRKRLDELEI